ncbi:MAG: tetratricopeptide repeat protein [Burkholderiales bacterium]
MNAFRATLTAARIRHCLVGAVLAGIVIGAGSVGVAALAPVATALAQEQKSDGKTVRPEIGKPLQAALDLLKHRRGKEALARVHEADAVPNKTPYESYLVTRVRAQSEAASGEAAGAGRDFETIAAAPAASGAERVQFLGAAAGQYYLARNYAKAAELAGRYFKDGGSDKSMRTLYIQALYLANDFAAAGKALQSEIQSEEQAGKTPAEEQLQLLANVYAKQHDNAAYGGALEQLATYYPKKEYWLGLVDGVAGRAGFSERLSLDLARLKLATGTMRTASEYVEAAQLSILAGLPAEAKKFIDQGYAAGLLGTGAEAARQQRLKEMAAKNLAEDNRTLGQDDAEAAAAKDGTIQLNSGLNYVLHGNSAKGLEMMEQGLRKGGLKHPDDARLHLGYAYYLAGQNQKAIRVFKTIHGTDGTGRLARLWIIRLGRES